MSSLSSLYFGQQPLIICMLWNDFLPFSRQLFHFVDLLFRYAKAFQLDAVPLVYFCFHCLCFWYQIQKIIAKTYVKSLRPMFPSRIFMVSGLTFKFLIHFELIFVYSVRQWLFYCVQVSSFPNRFIEETLLIVHSQLLCCKLMYYICLGLFLGFLFCSIISESILMPIPYFLNYCSFVIQFQIRDHDASRFVFLSQDCFG